MPTQLNTGQDNDCDRVHGPKLWRQQQSGCSDVARCGSFHPRLLTAVLNPPVAANACEQPACLVVCARACRADTQTQLLQIMSTMTGCFKWPTLGMPRATISWTVVIDQA